jgi:acyl-CoA synthetase (AMP-forming)/AMP-acid ligase II
LADGENEQQTLTYKELDRQARAIATLLLDMKASGERALLLYPAGLEFVAGFFGCLYAGVVAIPSYPPDPARLNRTLPRLRAIAADSQAGVVLTTASIMAMARALFAQAPDLAGLKWLATDDLPAGVENSWGEPEVSAGTQAFIQYTSGSTGTPKGVMLSHGNLLHNARLVHYAFEHKPADKYVSWLPTFHDMGFMAGVLQPLYAGIPAVLMPPTSFLQSPIRWLKAITRYKATTGGGPNFAYDLCARRVSPEERKELDLRSWTVAFNGSEPVRAQTLSRFAEAFEPCGFRREAFYPCYGLAEATLIVSGGFKDKMATVERLSASALERNRAIEAESQEDAIALVSCGRNLLDQKIAIVDPETLMECPPGQVGEIWVSGRSVAGGYWNRVEETEQIFNARICRTEEGPFLRTGDLGFSHDEELFITSRVKDLIIIRGLNHYPQDIELTVERNCASLRPGCGAAFSLELEGEERLVVVYEVDQRKEFDPEAIFNQIRRAVSEEHDLQVHSVALIKPGSVPKTSSGKIQRYLCREGYRKGALEEIARHTLSQSYLETEAGLPSREELLGLEPNERRKALQAYLLEEASRVLSMPSAEIDPQRTLSSMGLDSLMAVDLKNRIELNLSAEVSLGSLLQQCTLIELADKIFDKLALHPSPAEPSAGMEIAARSEESVSYVQKSLWFLYEMAPDSAAYNITFAARIQADIDVEVLKGALETLVARHAALRTTFTTRDGEPFQRVHTDSELDFTRSDASGWTDEFLNRRLTEEGNRPFDLEHGPLLRVRLFTRSADHHVLLMTMHHIIMDGWSVWVLLDELRALYPALQAGRQNPLPAPGLQYADYVHWQTEMLEGIAGQRLRSYWEKRLGDVIPVVSLPTDRPRSSVQSRRGDSYAFALGKELVEKLAALARAEGATLYMLLLAAFQILLYRYTGQEDIVVGSPTSARSRADFDATVGCFFNTIVLRERLSGNPTFKELLRSVRGTVLGALDHQDFPTHLLAESLNPTRDPSRPPLFQVTFILQKPRRIEKSVSVHPDESQIRIDLGWALLEPIAVPRLYARAELELELLEAGEAIFGTFHFNSDLFDATTIERMGGHYRLLLEGIVADPRKRVGSLPILPGDELDRLLGQWSNSGLDYSHDACLHDLIKNRAESVPDKAAAVYRDLTWTYQEIDEQAEKLADLLRGLK